MVPRKCVAGLLFVFPIDIPLILLYSIYVIEISFLLYSASSGFIIIPTREAE